MADADAVPELALLLRLACRAPAIDVGFSAAEAIGKVGAPAEEAFLRAAMMVPRHEHYWFHYAAACLGTPGASDFVLNELERNRPLADRAALALAVLGLVVRDEDPTIAADPEANVGSTSLSDGKPTAIGSTRRAVET